jgi:hypothetical protein
MNDWSVAHFFSPAPEWMKLAVTAVVLVALIFAVVQDHRQQNK